MRNQEKFSQVQDYLVQLVQEAGLGNKISNEEKPDVDHFPLKDLDSLAAFNATLAEDAAEYNKNVSLLWVL